MKKITIALAFLAVAGFAAAQDYSATKPVEPLSACSKNGVFNHLDAAFTVGTTGFGFDLAVPVTDWVRLRAGGAFRLSKHYDASLGTEIAVGLPEEEQSRRFDKLSTMMESFMGTAPTRTLELEGDMRMNNFKFLVDVYPFKNNRHWRATVGFFYGNGTIVDGRNTAVSVNTLAAISSYNMMYEGALDGHFMDMTELGITIDGQTEQKIVNKLLSWGECTDANGASYYAEYGISIPMGTYSHDVVALQDVYDANGNLRHRKGEVIRRAGETVRMVPDDDDMIHYDVHVNKFKPYLGVGYELAVSKDKRSTIGIDAGVLFWGGKPGIDFKLPVGKDAEGKNIYQTLDLVSDVDNVPGKLGDHVSTARDYCVYPEVSVRFARRLW